MTGLSDWNAATANLPWGVQDVFRSTLESVKDEQINLVYGADYANGSPCLINATAVMLGKINGEGGSGKPSAFFGPVVSAFDNANRDIASKLLPSQHTPGLVSPIAAEILLGAFGAMKDKPIASSINEAMANEAFATGTYVEPSDDDMAREWLLALSAPCSPPPLDENDLDGFMAQLSDQLNALLEENAPS